MFLKKRNDLCGTYGVLTSASLSTSDAFDHRIYMPSLGTFIQADPLGYPDGANRYQVELGNPIDAVDPNGLLTKGPADIPGPETPGVDPEREAPPLPRDRSDSELLASLTSNSWAVRQAAENELKRRASTDANLSKTIQDLALTTSDLEQANRLQQIWNDLHPSPPRKTPNDSDQQLIQPYLNMFRDARTKQRILQNLIALNRRRGNSTRDLQNLLAANNQRLTAIINSEGFFVQKLVANGLIYDKADILLKEGKFGVERMISNDPTLEAP